MTPPCSVTGMRSAFRFCRPYFVRICAKPASASRRFVSGEDQVIWWNRWKSVSQVPPADSGATVGDPPAMHSRHIFCSSQKMLNLLRGVACHVRRSGTFVQVPS
ncbi:hypothetical protein D3C83_49630 [compost metagenome]